ncbi:MAG: long-chain fatty acid--CoA ligase [Proteobacteria bacterium]|nr:long-chain fatty acid--CoA ligase [Pseudomonadota bacterium]
MSHAAVATPPPTESLIDVFLSTVDRLPEAPAARVKIGDAWEDTTWAEMAAQARRYAFGLIALGVQPGDRVNLLGNTTLDWVLCELGIHMAGAVSVPIYQTNPSADCAYVVRDSGAVLLIAENEHQLEKIIPIRGELESLRHVLRMDGNGTEDIPDLEALAERGDQLAKEQPAAVDQRIGGIDPADAACFIYTSGTTGPPKGVVLSHATWAFEAQAIEELGIVTPDDVQLLFLPLAHSFAQVLKTGWYKTGHTVAFAESMDQLVANLAEVKPTVMAAVPRVFEKVYGKVFAGGMESPGLTGTLFRWAFGHVDAYVHAQKRGVTYHGGLGFSLAKALVLSKVAKKLDKTFGGNIKFFISGGAPLAPTIAYFFELVGVKVLEGYGLTETAAATCVNRPEMVKIGTVGPAVPGMEIRIADDGEVLIRGPGVMTGYHGKPEATAEAIDAEGWFLTGDIGSLDEDGYLSITDRKKDIIVTAGGKNVAPQNLENSLKTYPLVSQAVVHGDKRKFLTALITVDPAAAVAWAHERGLSEDVAELVQTDELTAEIQGYFDDLNKDLPRYLTLKKFGVLDHDFSQDSGELTPTLKVKRRIVEERYRERFEAFYAGLE